LKLSPASLSLVLSRKLQLSKKSLDKITRVIPMSAEQLNFLYRNVKKGLGVSHEATNPITMEIFAVLSEWYHFAILSLLEIPNLKETQTENLDPRWISKKLGITVTEAKLAIDRLVNLGLIKRTSARWRQVSAPMRIGNELSTAAARNFQKQLIEKALGSLQNDQPETRDVTSMTFAMNPKDLAHASKKITQFRRNLTRDLETKSESQAVYTLTIQLFPMTKESR
jgi:uncharacterized protein (TIGR02147 family)